MLMISTKVSGILVPRIRGDTGGICGSVVRTHPINASLILFTEIAAFGAAVSNGEPANVVISRVFE
jgi:hypothetical protein